MDRLAGVILHPSSFPNDHGIGNFGESAYRFVDVIAESGFKLWQMCPLGPTSYGDSPYQCFSAFAGNPYFIDWNQLIANGYIEAEDISRLKRKSMPLLSLFSSNSFISLRNMRTIKELS